MPNTVVKLINAESTWLEAAWEDRKLLIKKERDTQKCVSFFVVSARRGKDGREGVLYGNREAITGMTSVITSAGNFNVHTLFRKQRGMRNGGITAFPLFYL